jgi:uncharacterized protein YheU (UPF0270 family)
MDSETEKPSPIEIPVSAISAELLDEIILSFIAREGTDYGAVEASLEKKVGDIRRQLDKGEIKLIFDPETESVTFVAKF